MAGSASPATTGFLNASDRPVDPPPSWSRPTSRSDAGPSICSVPRSRSSTGCRRCPKSIAQCLLPFRTKRGLRCGRAGDQLRRIGMRRVLHHQRREEVGDLGSPVRHVHRDVPARSRRIPKSGKKKTKVTALICTPDMDGIDIFSRNRSKCGIRGTWQARSPLQRRQGAQGQSPAQGGTRTERRTDVPELSAVAPCRPEWSEPDVRRGSRP